MHDITAARAHALPALYRAAAASLLTLANPLSRHRQPGKIGDIVRAALVLTHFEHGDIT